MRLLHENSYDYIEMLDSHDESSVDGLFTLKTQSQALLVVPPSGTSKRFSTCAASAFNSRLSWGVEGFTDVSNWYYLFIAEGIQISDMLTYYWVKNSDPMALAITQFAVQQRRLNGTKVQISVNAIVGAVSKSGACDSYLFHVEVKCLCCPQTCLQIVLKSIRLIASCERHLQSPLEQRLRLPCHADILPNHLF